MKEGKQNGDRVPSMRDVGAFVTGAVVGVSLSYSPENIGTDTFHGLTGTINGINGNQISDADGKSMDDAVMIEAIGSFEHEPQEVGMRRSIPFSLLFS